MASQEDITAQKTQWTEGLLEDLCTSLERGKDSVTVNGFARELMEDKQLPREYLVRKVRERSGDAAATRLDGILTGKAVRTQAGGASKKSYAAARRRGKLLGFLQRIGLVS